MLRDDYFHGFDGDDVIRGLDGDDTLIGGEGYDDIVGGNGNDVVYGDYMDTSLTADGIMSDDLYGGSGDDVLVGGPGADNLFGNDGKDTFVINTLDYYDYIGDFSSEDIILFPLSFAPMIIQVADDLIINFYAAGSLEGYLADPNGDGNSSDWITAPSNSTSLLLITDGIHSNFYKVVNDDNAQLLSSELTPFLQFAETNDINIIAARIEYSDLYVL